MLEGYEQTDFTAPIQDSVEVTHDVYSKGNGPVVVVIQELPGIGKETLRLADLLVDAGYRVVLPHLFGPLGRISMLGNLWRVMCMRREFSVLEKGGASPIVNWLRSLCQSLRDEYQCNGVGVIGMCLTGNFAISLMADDAVLAGVASQPSMPFFDQRALHMSDQDVSAISSRLDAVGAMHAYRFAGDKICQKEKFDSLEQAFNGDGKERIKLKTLPGKGHSVFTLDFVDEAGHPTRDAFDAVLDYFQQQLR